jgi:hypothetical protein
MTMRGPLDFHWLVVITSLLCACGPFDLGKKGWQCKNAGMAFSGASEANTATVPLAARAWAFDAPRWGQPKAGNQELAATGGRIATVTYSFIGSNNKDGSSLHFDGSTYVHGLINDPASLQGAARNRAQVGGAAEAGGDGPSLISSSSITYSLWLSPHERWLNADADPDAGTGSNTGALKMVLLSTRWEQDETRCGGHELSLIRHMEPDDRGVQLSFGYYESHCEWTAHPVLLALDGHLTPDAWGKWHHVAATYDRGHVTLYWNNDRKIQHQVAQLTSPAQDGSASPAQLCLGADCVTHPKPDSSTPLCVGAGCASTAQRQAPDWTTIKYIGLIDEVAIFDRALDEPQINSLWVASQTPITVGSVQWIARSGPRSSSSLSIAPGGGVLLEIVDGESSAGGAIALLDAKAGATSLSKVNLAKLSANLPPGEYPLGLNVTANQGREFCAWYIEGTGGNEYYLGRLPPYTIESRMTDAGGYPSYLADRRLRYTSKWCRCDDCECSSRVEEANIYSPWLEIQSQTCTLCDLQVSDTEDDRDSTANNGTDWSSSRGEWGPQGLCWRPISYNQNSFAQFTEKPSQDGVSARLAGDPKSGALLVADFGVRSSTPEATGSVAGEQELLDLGNCSTVCLEATYASNSQQTSGDENQAVPSVVVVSANSATAELDARTASAHEFGPGKYCVDLSKFQDAKNPDGIIDESDWDKTGNSSVVGFDWHRVRYIGLQKDWKNEEDVVTNIRGIHVCAKGGGACTLTGRWSSLANGPCTHEN